MTGSECPQLSCEELEQERDRLASELYTITTQVADVLAHLEDALYGGKWKSTDDPFEYLIQLQQRLQRIGRETTTP